MKPASVPVLDIVHSVAGSLPFLQKRPNPNSDFAGLPSFLCRENKVFCCSFEKAIKIIRQPA
jgi:hypothetical protein